MANQKQYRFIWILRPEIGFDDPNLPEQPREPDDGGDFGKPAIAEGCVHEKDADHRAAGGALLVPGRWGAAGETEAAARLLPAVAQSIWIPNHEPYQRAAATTMVRRSGLVCQATMSCDAKHSMVAEGVVESTECLSMGVPISRH